MTQEAMPPPDWFEIYEDAKPRTVLELLDDATLNPWANGDHAFLAIVCGLIFMLTVSVGVSL